MTMGMGTILRAKQIVVIATGRAKAQAVYKTIEAPVSEEWPSALLRNHADAYLIADNDAASEISSRVLKENSKCCFEPR
jgi:glucosamine-6-phosphate deaminase